MGFNSFRFKKQESAEPLKPLDYDNLGDAPQEELKKHLAYQRERMSSLRRSGERDEADDAEKCVEQIERELEHREDAQAT